MLRAARAPCLREPVNSALDGIDSTMAARSLDTGIRQLGLQCSVCRRSRCSAVHVRRAPVPVTLASTRRAAAPGQHRQGRVCFTGSAGVVHLSARYGTKTGSAALTSFGVRGRLSRSCALPIPRTFGRCVYAGSLSAGKICLQFTRCAWRCGPPKLLSRVSGSTPTVSALVRAIGSALATGMPPNPTLNRSANGWPPCPRGALCLFCASRARRPSVVARLASR